MKSTSVSVNSMIENLKILLRNCPKSDLVELIFKPIEHSNFAVEADPIALRQVLLNVCTNALKFTDQGSVLINVEKLDDKICFIISDTGKGMTEDFITKNLFKPYSQVRKKRITLEFIFISGRKLTVWQSKRNWFRNGSFENIG